MSELGTHTFLHTLICEDIRAELNGKNTIVGVHSGKMYSDNLPQPVKLAFYIVGKPKTYGTNRLVFRILDPNDDLINEDVLPESQLEKDTQETIICAVLSPLVHKIPGEYRFQVSENKGRWKTLRTYEVRTADEISDKQKANN